MMGISGLYAGINPMFLSQRQLDAMKKFEEDAIKERLSKCVPYDPLMKWHRHMNIQGKTWESYKLFNIKNADISGPPNEPLIVTLKDPARHRLSKDGRFLYLHLPAPAGMVMDTAYANRRGSCVFDSPISVPALYQKDFRGNFRKPWMSITPSEVFSLRGGNRLAKGHTVIAGLGLGYQLVQVALRKQVKKITVVEMSQELVDFVMPAIMKHIDMKKRPDLEIDVVIGDAHQLVPKMKADVALIDIYPKYGGNEFYHCPEIKKVWIWGSQFVSGGR